MHFLHAHVLIESSGRIMAVDIQFHAARGGVKIPDGINGHFKKSSSQSVLPESGEYINLLQVKQVVAFLLDRDVAGCLSVLIYKVILLYV